VVRTLLVVVVVAKRLKLLISALEPSANLHLKEILRSEDFRDIEVSGLFDPSLGSPNISSTDFGVMGIFSVIPKLLKAKESLNKMVELAKDSDKILLIDAPAFNLPLAKKIKAKYPDKEIIYYILPKVWAWKPKRIEAVNRYIDKQIAIFPFEKDYYGNSLYFGNPLLSELKNLRNEIQKDGAVAFLAGSRKSEIKNLMPTFRELAGRLDGEKILVIPPHLRDLSIYGDISGFTIYRDTETALADSRFAYICSGTATLEASLIGVPFVLVYKTSPLEFAIGKRFVKLKYVGLANIIFEKMGLNIEFHREFLQNFNIDELLELSENIDYERFLENSKRLQEILKGSPEKEIIEIIKTR
jgi:lipid-A-disaccharide synthase